MGNLASIFLLKLINFITQFLLIFGKLGIGDLLHFGKLGIEDLLVFYLALEIFAFCRKLLILAIQTFIPTLLSFQGFLNFSSCIDKCYISALKLRYAGRFSVNLFTLVISFI